MTDSYRDIIENHLVTPETKRLLRTARRLYQQLNDREVKLGYTLSDFTTDVLSDVDIDELPETNENLMEDIEFGRQQLERYDHTLSKPERNRQIKRHCRYLIEPLIEQLLSFFNIKSLKHNIIKIENISLDSDAHSDNIQVFHFKLNNTDLIYKSRLSIIDKNVIKLFSSINHIIKQHGLPGELKTYRILNLLRCPCSIWDYKGNTLVNTNHIITIDDIIADLDQPNLILLIWLSNKIGLTDLHGSNVIIENGNIIPIDLEVVHEYNTKTGLLHSKETEIRFIQLGENIYGGNVEIQHAINKFNEKIHTMFIRRTPISTGHWKDLLFISPPKDLDEIADTFNENYYERYHRNIDTDDLIAYIAVCRDKGHVPFFSVRESTPNILYGGYEQQYIIKIL